MAEQDDSSSGGSVEIVTTDSDGMNDPNMPILPNNGLPVMVNGDMCTDGPTEVQEPFDATQPYLIVSEQPQSRGFRFRYKCEGPSHGGLQGVNSQKSKKTFPAVRIMNYKGKARIVVTLVTDNVVPKIHAHELVGKNCQNGICVVELKGNEPKAEYKFQNLGIMHVTKKNVKTILEQRIMESMKLDHLIKLGNIDMTANFDLKGPEKQQAKQQAEKEAKLMQLNVVKLCFQAYLTDSSGQFTRLLPSVLSDPIFDSKSPGAAALKICRMDKYGGCCTGNEEVFLLCEKVQKDDIGVRFVEADEEGNVIWEDWGNFGPNDVHRQFAIVFKTPAYKDRRIQKAVTVQIQLKRLSDEELSDPKSFTYYPEDSDKEGIDRKRRKVLPGMGPSSYTSGEGRGDGGGSYGGGNGRSNGPYFEHSDPGMETYSYGGGHAGQQYQFGIKGNNKVSQVDRFQSKQYQQRNTTSRKAKLDERDLQTDSMPFDGDLNLGKLCRPKVENLHKSADYSDDGFFSQEMPKTSIEESKVDNEQEESKTEAANATSVPSSTMPSSLSSDQMLLKLAERTSLALLQYACTGDIKALLMVQRHLTFMSDENGDLPLHLAIINRRQEVVEQLLSVMTTIPNAGRKVNGFNHLKQTPLHLAVLTQQTYVIDLLLQHGANPSLVDRCGNTPAHLATKAGDEACVRALTKYLRPGVTQEKPFPELDLLNYEGQSPVHLAAASGNLNTLKAVCVRRGDINMPDGKSGRTPLHYAVEAADVSLAGYLLLEAGADPNAGTFDNNTPLHIACGRAQTGMVAILMAAGANPDLENDDVPNGVESDEDSDEEECVHNSDLNDTSESNKMGMRPRDLVTHDKKILRILDGEPYASIQEIDVPVSTAQTHHLSSYHTALRTESPTMESGIASFFGSLCYLNYASRARLSRLLDPICEGKDWYTLADKLGFHSMVDIFAQIPSSTKAVIDHLEGCNGTVEKLRKVLEEMNRTDAVSVIDEAIRAYQGEVILNNAQSFEKVMPRVDQVRQMSMHFGDSGITDMNFGT